MKNSNNKTSTDIVYTTEKSVKCLGLEAPFDHPAIYLNIKDESVTCPYCSKIFRQKK